MLEQRENMKIACHFLFLLYSDRSIHKKKKEKKKIRRTFTFSTATLWLFRLEYNALFSFYNVFYYFCKCLMLQSQSFESNLRFYVKFSSETDASKFLLIHRNILSAFFKNNKIIIKRKNEIIIIKK